MDGQGFVSGRARGFSHLLTLILLTWRIRWARNNANRWQMGVNPLNADLNPICHLLAFLGAHLIFHVSGLRVNSAFEVLNLQEGAVRSHPRYEHTKMPERDSDSSTTSSDEVEEWEESHLYTPIHLPGWTGTLWCVGVMAKLRKATISFVMSVCPSVRTKNSAPTGRIFVEFDILVFLEKKICPENSSFIKTWQQ